MSEILSLSGLYAFVYGNHSDHFVAAVAGCGSVRNTSFSIFTDVSSDLQRATSNEEPDMLICRVVGDIVSTIKNQHLKGHKLLLVQPVDLDGETPKGEAMIALDKVDAGPQDLVLVNREGGAARMLLNNPKIPVQAVIVGVIDNLDVAL